jgi:hypothetical protein
LVVKVHVKAVKAFRELGIAGEIALKHEGFVCIS